MPGFAGETFLYRFAIEKFREQRNPTLSAFIIKQLKPPDCLSLTKEQREIIDSLGLSNQDEVILMLARGNLLNRLHHR